MKCLLKAGANPNLRDSAGWTPLHCACKSGHIRICELLLSWKSIDPSILTIEKISPLFYYVRKSPSADDVSLSLLSFSLSLSLPLPLFFSPGSREAVSLTCPKTDPPSLFLPPSLSYVLIF